MKIRQPKHPIRDKYKRPEEVNRTLWRALPDLCEQYAEDYLDESERRMPGVPRQVLADLLAGALLSKEH